MPPTKPKPAAPEGEIARAIKLTPSERLSYRAEAYQEASDHIAATANEVDHSPEEKEEWRIVAATLYDMAVRLTGRAAEHAARAGAGKRGKS